MAVHHRQQQLVTIRMPPEPTCRVNHAARLIGSKVFPPGNIRLFSASLPIAVPGEVQDLRGVRHPNSLNIPLFGRKAECFVAGLRGWRRELKTA
jgi:hypothetical protein